MKLKIISGGQTGADIGGLLAAEDEGIPTGGMAPLGYRTNLGPNLELRDRFKLLENESPDYGPRTEWNVKYSEATLIFAYGPSPGCDLTHRLCKRHNKRFWLDPPNDISWMTSVLSDWLDEARRRQPLFTLNIAGHREESYPGIRDDVRRSVRLLVQQMRERGLITN